MSPVCTDPRPTWLEHWPLALAALSFRQALLPLSSHECHALGRANGIGAGVFRPDGAAALDGLARRIDAAIDPAWPQGAFVRLGGRSPRDTAVFLASAGQARDGASALALLGAGSARIGFELRRAVREGWPQVLALREWHPIAPQDEWRVFLDRGMPVGACPAWPAPREAAPPRLAELVALAQRVAAAWGLAPVVADLWLPPAGPPRLIELNPWGPPTEAGCFAWDAPFDATLRWPTAAGVATRPLAQAGAPAG